MIDVAPTLDQRAGRSGENSFATSGGLIPVPHANMTYLGNAEGGAADVPFITASSQMRCVNNQTPLIGVTHSLRGEGFDASEDGTPLVPTYTLAIRGRGDSHNLEYRDDGTANALLTPSGGRGGIGVGAVAIAQNQRDEVRIMNVAGALAAEPGAKQQTYVAFSSKDHGADAGEISPTLRSMSHDGSHANGGGHVAVAFAHQAGGTQTSLGYDPDSNICQTIGAHQTPAIAGMQVRRLTPMECERLQGFSDNYTLIPITKRQPVAGQPAVVKMSADGPRYKALGNSWAVPCARWIGERIAMVEQINMERHAA